MKNPIKTADEAYTDIAILVDRNLEELRSALVATSTITPHWGHVGNLNYVNDQLTELIRFVRFGESHADELEELKTENENLKARIQRLGG